MGQRWIRNRAHEAWRSLSGTTLRRWMLILALVPVCGGCETNPGWTPLTPADIADHGTVVLEAPRQTVLEACVLALRKQGYAIDAAEPDTGLIVTARRAEPGSPPEARLFRAYVVEVKDSGAGRARVSAWPAVSEAGAARGTRRYTARAWDLDGERAAWTRLFEDVRAIVEKASP